MRAFAALGFAVMMLSMFACSADIRDHGPKQPYQVLQHRPDRLIVALPNRLIVVAQELHTAPVVSTQVHVKTGSIYEQTESRVGAGLSHFLEHLVSGGTTEIRSEKESNAALGRIGAMTNASTSLDTVRYYINTTRPHASEAIELLSDWLQNSEIRQHEFARERDVIQREFEMGMGEPRRIFWKLTQQARFRYHPARHPTIGYLDEFLKVSRDDIYAFYRQMYVPNNMVFLVVGDIDSQQVVDQVASLWANRAAQPLPRVRLPIEPSIAQPRAMSGTADIERPRLRLAWPGTRLAAPGDYALDVLAVVLGQGESSRLVQTVRDQHRAVNVISAFNLSFAWGEGFFSIDAEISKTDREAVETTKSLILDQVAALLSAGVTHEELERAKRQIVADTIYNSQSVEALAGRLSHGLMDMGDPDYQLRYAEHIQSLTNNDIMAAANKFLQEQRMITVTLLPGDKVAQDLTRPADDPALADAEFETRQLDNQVIIERMRAASRRREVQPPIVADPVQMHVLDNGLRVLIGRSTLVPAVAIQIYQLGGLLSDPPGHEGLAKAVARTRIRGTTSHSAEQIAQQIERIGASLGSDCGYNSSFTRAVCLKQDLPAVLELFADVVINPTFPDEEWQKMRQRLVASIDRLTDTWHGELRQQFRQAYYDQHPWAYTPLGNGQVMAALQAQNLSEAFHRRLSASESVLAIFGDVDAEQTMGLVSKLFADLPRQGSIPFNARMPQTPMSALVRHKTSKPLGAVQIGFGPGATRNSDDYPVLQTLTRVFGRFPSGWLDQELRGAKGGLVYAVSCRQFAGLVPGYIGILFNASPKKLGEALQRTAAVVERARTELVGSQNLADAKATVLTNEFFYRQSNADRAQQAALDVLYGLGLDEPDRFMQRVQDVDAESLRQIARKYLTNPVTIVLSHQPIDEDSLQSAVHRMGAE